MKTRKAIVLAAGLGTRLRPLTCAVPKPLLPVWGEPMLARVIALLRGWGVDDIVVNCHYLHEQVEEFVSRLASATDPADSFSIRTSYEPEILGTGGVLNPLRTWIGGDDFYLVNADIVVEGIDANPFAEAWGDGEIAQCLVTREGPRTIEVEPESRFVTCWQSPDPGWDGTFTYCGVARLRADILKFVAPTGFSTIVAAYEQAMMDGRFVRAVEPADLMWTDAGTVESYLSLNRTADDNAFADLPQLKAAAARLPSDAPVEFLVARGSERVFFKRGDAIIIIYDDAHRGENARYVHHANWLKAQGVPVPAILADLPDLKTLVMENAGATDLQHRVEKAGAHAIDSYVPVVEALAAFNALNPDFELEPPFDAALYRWERDLFAEHCLGTRYAMALPDDVRAELEGVAAKLLAEPPALVHRDFQSTNVLWKNDRLSIIDFQGMRRGPAAYDLASLLYDPYVRLTDRARHALAALYAQKSGRGDIAAVLPFAAVGRLVQCLGAYGRLASVGQPQFGRFVLPALENLLAAADEAGLDATGALAEELIAREQKRGADGGPAHGCACGHEHHHHGKDCQCGR